MPSVLELEPLPVEVPAVDARFEKAAQLLEKAASATGQDANILYMVAMAYKRQGKIAEARATLKKIQKPDANIFLQLGVLSLKDNQPGQAEQEFARAWQMDQTSYGACYNLLMTRLTLGQLDSCHSLIPAAQQLTRDPEQRRFLEVLAELLKYVKKEIPGDGRDLVVLSLDSPLESLSADEEKKLLKLIRSLGQVDSMFQLMRTLWLVRPRSVLVAEAYYEIALAKGRDLMNRCAWTEALWLLTPLGRERGGSRPQQVALANLLGCCYYVTQDFEKAGDRFEQAVKLSPNDPRVHHNLALAYERNNEPSQAEAHWNRFLDLLDRTSLPIPPDVPRYLQSLECETLMHLANAYAAKEKWPTVLTYLQRVHKMKPDDPDILERMFHVYNHTKQPNNARKTLDRLRDMRPNDPQLELYELDLVEVRNLNDIERHLTEIERILRRYPGDHRVEERAVNMVGSIIPLMYNLCDQLSEQLGKVQRQVKNLSRYQVDYGALREIMRDLVREFQKLRRITSKCSPLVTHDDHMRIVRELADRIDRKIDECRDLGG